MISMLDKQHRYIICYFTYTPSLGQCLSGFQDVDSIMYVRSIIQYILAPQARLVTFIHPLGILE